MIIAGAKAIQANLKDNEEGSGKYFPILAANQFTQDGKFINGVYIPHVFALQFEGPYEWKKVSVVDGLGDQCKANMLALPR